MHGHWRKWTGDLHGYYYLLFRRRLSVAAGTQYDLAGGNGVQPGRKRAESSPTNDSINDIKNDHVNRRLSATCPCFFDLTPYLEAIKK